MNGKRLYLMSMICCGFMFGIMLLSACSDQAGDAAELAAGLTEEYEEEINEDCGALVTVLAWFDANGNGQWEQDESPLSDITIRFRDAEYEAAEGFPVVTNSDGEAQLDEFLPGCPEPAPRYTVFPEVPDGYQLTTQALIEDVPGDADPLYFGFTSAEVGGIVPTPGLAAPICTVYRGIGKGSEIADMAAAPDGTLWVAILGGGIARLDLDSETWTYYTDQDGLASNQASTIEIMADGTLLIGTDRGVSHFDGKTWTTLPITNILLPMPIYEMAIDQNSILWAAFEEGLLRLDLQTGEWLARKLGNPAGTIILFHDVLVAQDGSIWLPTLTDGVVRVHASPYDAYDQQWTFFVASPESYNNNLPYVDHQEAPFASVNAIGEARDGTLWFSAEGLWRRDPQSEGFTRIEGASSEVSATDLVVGPDGSLWMATETEGVIRYFPNRHPQAQDAWFYYDTRDGLGSNSISELLFSSDGTAWFVSGEDLTHCTFP